jgi:hypothetical protein
MLDRFGTGKPVPSPSTRQPRLPTTSTPDNVDSRPGWAPQARTCESQPASCSARHRVVSARIPTFGGNHSSEPTASHSIPRCLAPGRCRAPPRPPPRLAFSALRKTLTAEDWSLPGRTQRPCPRLCLGRGRRNVRPAPFPCATAAAERRLTALFRWTLHRPGRPNGQPDRGRVCPPGWTPGLCSLPLTPGRRRWGGVRPVWAPLNAPPPLLAVARRGSPARLRRGLLAIVEEPRHIAA